MLIVNAELNGSRICQVRVEGETITAIAADLSPKPGETVIDAQGGALLPGLNDHHLHLQALAAALDSIPCGPPRVHCEQALAQALQSAAATRPGEWLRGIGYHESVAGDIDRDWLDRLVPDSPVRLQHRSGRLWILNSAALERLGGPLPGPLECREGRPTGRLYDGDDWLRQRLGGQRPALARVSRLLASHGITGVTDTSQHNGPEEYAYFHREQRCGHLSQTLRLMGNESLNPLPNIPGLEIGELKIHLHEADLPDFDLLCARLRRCRNAGRRAAFHCVTRSELFFALGILEAVGATPGDRIEHGAIVPDDALPLLAATGVTVVTQPHFIAERGDSYLRDVAVEDQPWLYRGQGILSAGIPLAAGSDAPYGDPNPWKAMAAAVERRSPTGQPLGPAEALCPEDALALFSAPLDQPGRPSPIRIGQSADLCLIDRPWIQARSSLGNVQVRLTLHRGHPIHTRQD